MAEVLMPQMGESIAEGTLTRWFKKPGETVKRDEPLFEISTDNTVTPSSKAQQTSLIAGVPDCRFGATEAAPGCRSVWCGFRLVLVSEFESANDRAAGGEPDGRSAIRGVAEFVG